MQSQEFIDSRTGEIVTAVPLSEIAYFDPRQVYGWSEYGDHDNTHTASLSEYFEETNKRHGYGAGRLAQYVEITEAAYWYFLEVLFPMNWNGNRFWLSEALTDTADGTIRHEFCQRGSRYLHRYVCVPHAINAAAEREHY